MYLVRILKSHITRIIYTIIVKIQLQMCAAILCDYQEHVSNYKASIFILNAIVFKRFEY